MEKQKLIVKNDDTLLNTLGNILNYSNKKIKQFLENNMISVNGKIITKGSTVVNTNDIIVISYSKEKTDTLINIIYEDSDIIVVDKPEGLLTISNRKEKDRTMYHMVSDYLKKSNRNAKVFVVHRLDEATSGVLMFAKNEKMQGLLQERWNEIVTSRKYFAIVPCNIPLKGHIESYLMLSSSGLVYSTKNKEKGYLAITDFTLEKYENGYSLLDVDIKTGRRNQIRVHLSENYAPIIGDKKYGSRDNPIKRLGLHAYKISLIDPRNKKEIVFESKIPSVMKGLFKNE